MKEIELYWLAGILEGEGSFMMSRNHVGGKLYLYPKITVCMTDKDIIKRVADLLGVGVYEVPKVPGRKAAYRTSLSGTKAALVMQQLKPIMGHRRAGKIDEILIAYGEIESTDVRRARSCSESQKARWAKFGTRSGRI